MKHAAWSLPHDKDAQSVKDALLAHLNMEGTFDSRGHLGITKPSPDADTFQ